MLSHKDTLHLNSVRAAFSLYLVSELAVDLSAYAATMALCIVMSYLYLDFGCKQVLTTWLPCQQASIFAIH